MSAIAQPAMLFFQDAATMSNDLHIIMICEVVLTLIVVIVLAAVVIGALIVYSKINKLTKEASAKAQPFLAKGQQIAGSVNDIVADLKPKIASISADLQPKIQSISGDVQHISSLVRSKVDEAGQTLTRVNETVRGYNETAQDVNQKARGQVDRVNGMVGEALTTTQHVSKQIQHGIRVPVEKIASWVTAAKLGLEGLAEKVPFLHSTMHSGHRSTAATTTERPGPRPVERTGAATIKTEAPGRTTPPSY